MRQREVEPAEADHMHCSHEGETLQKQAVDLTSSMRLMLLRSIQAVSVRCSPRRPSEPVHPLGKLTSAAVCTRDFVACHHCTPPSYTKFSAVPSRHTIMARGEILSVSQFSRTRITAVAAGCQAGLRRGLPGPRGARTAAPRHPRIVRAPRQRGAAPRGRPRQDRLHRQSPRPRPRPRAPRRQPLRLRWQQRPAVPAWLERGQDRRPYRAMRREHNARSHPDPIPPSLRSLMNTSVYIAHVFRAERTRRRMPPHGLASVRVMMTSRTGLCT